MKKKSIVLLLLLLGACSNASKPATRSSKAAGSTSIDSLRGLSAHSLTNTRVSAMRAQALRDTALSLGARGGLSWRAAQINGLLIDKEDVLFRIFNFQSMMLDHSVLPPVLIEGRNTLNLAGIDSIRIADRNYQILNQAKFVTAPPTWRDYLWLSHSAPETPDRTLLPKNAEERIVWKKYVDEGWQAGIEQAELIYKESLGRLKRDFEGMIRYRSLLAQNMVSPPYVAKMDLGITGGDKELNINDRILRITAFPALNPEGKEWRAEITPHE